MINITTPNIFNINEISRLGAKYMSYNYNKLMSYTAMYLSIRNDHCLEKREKLLCHLFRLMFKA